MEGFLINRWIDRFDEGLSQMSKWIQEVQYISIFKILFWLILKVLVDFKGKIKVKETQTEGFEKMPEAFIDMLQGGNTGKAIIKVWLGIIYFENI